MMRHMPDLLAGLFGRASGATDTRPAKPPAEPAASGKRAAKAKPAEPEPVWPFWRLELMERLWGEGYTLPGGDAYIDRLAKSLTVGNASSVLYVGAGLGRPAQRISEVFGSFVDGIDPDPELAAIGAARAARKEGLARVKIAARPFVAANEMGRRYDALLGQEVLLESADREGLIACFVGALKPGGRLMLTDFVRVKADEGDAVADWARRDLSNGAPPDEKFYRELLKKLGLKLRVFEDLSDDYIAMILEGWQHFEAILNDRPADQAVMLGMLREAERWTRRVQIIRSGEIRYVRIIATARTGVG